MSRITTLKDEHNLTAFAEKAAADFRDNPEHATYGSINPGWFLALRWGLGGDCVLVVRLDEEFEPVNFQQAIERS